MDAERFDSLARSLASRLSRRTALRGAGAGLAGGFLAGVSAPSGWAAPARQDMAPAYIVVRQYQPSASISDVQQALNNYAPMLAQQSGFIGYSVIETDGGIASITVFDSQQNEEAASNALGDWVQQNLASILPEPSETVSGDSFVQSINRNLICAGGETPTAPAGNTPTPEPTSAPTEAAPTATAAAPTATALPVCTDPSRPGVGCECSTGTQNPCGDTTLVCCANEADAPPGAPGTCVPSSVGCEPTGPTPTVEPSPTPCTDIGCPCNAGVEGECAEGLVCCQSQMNAPNQPGGPGQCAAADACGDGGDGNGAGATPTG